MNQVWMDDPVEDDPGRVPDRKRFYEKPAEHAWNLSFKGMKKNGCVRIVTCRESSICQQNGEKAWF